MSDLPIKEVRVISLDDDELDCIALLSTVMSGAAKNLDDKAKARIVTWFYEKNKHYIEDKRQ